MHQDDRTKVISDFKKSDMSILVATDVAARGLDIPAIKTVVNYDVARDIDTHTHRIGNLHVKQMFKDRFQSLTFVIIILLGRTGRAGESGLAYTLMTPKDKEFAPHLVRNLESADQNVPQELVDLASQVAWFKNKRSSKHEGGKRRLNIGGKGLGFKERPGFGASKSTDSKVYQSFSFLVSLKKNVIYFVYE